MKRILHRKLDERFLPDIYIPDPNRGVAGVFDNPAFKKPSFWLLTIGGLVGTYFLTKGRVLTGFGVMGVTLLAGGIYEQNSSAA